MSKSMKIIVIKIKIENIFLKNIEYIRTLVRQGHHVLAYIFLRKYSEHVKIYMLKHGGIYTLICREKVGRR